MPAAAVQAYQWVVWGIGVVLFAAVIGLVIAAVVRAGRRPPPLHSAAERLQREVPQPPEVQAGLRELAALQQSGRISEVEYERRRAQVLAAPSANRQAQRAEPDGGDGGSRSSTE